MSREDWAPSLGRLRAYLRLLFRWKDIDDAVDRGGCGVCVKRCEGEVACLCDAESGLDCFKVAHFAYEHNVWVLAKCCAQGFCETFRVGVDFALIDQTTLVIVQKLYRVFDC